MSGSVLDASALLAYLHEEPGAERVEEALTTGSTISAANLAEVLGKLGDEGMDPAAVADKLRDRGLIGVVLAVEPVTDQDAVLIAQLRRPTKRVGLSLGDRACLALALRLDAPALTADGAWLDVEVGAQVQLIR